MSPQEKGNPNENADYVAENQWQVNNQSKKIFLKKT